MSTPSTTYCGQCGVPVAASARFCSTCGAPQFEADPPQFSEPPQRGMLRSLVDLDFESFITTRVVGFFYALFLGVSVLVYVVAAVSAFQEDQTTGVVVLTCGPFVVLLFIVIARVFLESRVALIKVAEHTARTARLLAVRKTP